MNGLSAAGQLSVDVGQVQLEGITRPVRLLEARPA